MNDSPLLSKMDALLKKHRGGNETDVHASSGLATAPEAPRHMPPADAWLPVLTDVIERGTPRVVSAPAAAAPPPAAQSAEPEAPIVEAPSPIVSDTLAEQLMSELAPRLSEVMEKQVAAELRKNLDQTVATLLSQLDGNVREIVREAIAEKLRQPRDPST
ncbi:MAG: hypothetical protein ACYCWB_02210 [Thiobacillus sp.]